MMQIRTLDELRALRPRAARAHLRRIELALPLAPEERRRAEAAINAGLRACGCGTGAVFALAAVLWSVARFAVQAARPDTGSLLAAGALVLGAALAGKALGLVAAEWRLRRTIDRLTRGASRTMPPTPRGSAFPAS
jgi:hypothetical protein